jgi:hypothetical protein
MTEELQSISESNKEIAKSSEEPRHAIGKSPKEVTYRVPK